MAGRYQARLTVIQPSYRRTLERERRSASGWAKAILLVAALAGLGGLVMARF